MPTTPYRALLMASVAVLAISGGASGQTISTPVTGPVNVTVGTPLTVTESGSILSSDPDDAVVAGVASPSLSNSGLIGASGQGIGLHVTGGGSLDVVTNSGTVTQTGPLSQTAVGVDAGGIIGVLNNLGTGSIGSAAGIALDVNGQLGTVTNSGTIGSLAGSTTGGIVLESGSSSTLIVNNAGGQILASAYSGNAVDVKSLGAGSLTNASGGTIAAGGAYGSGVSIGYGSLNSLTNAGLIAANGTSGSGVYLYQASITNLTNVGLIQANNSAGVGINLRSGTITALTNDGLIQANGYSGTGILVGYSYAQRRLTAGILSLYAPLAPTSVIGTLTNGGTIQANGYNGVGIRLTNGTINTLTNTGLIQANGDYGAGVAVGYGSKFRPGINVVSTQAIPLRYANTIGTLTNSGTIQANGYGGGGIVLLNGTINTLSNTGLIQANGTYGFGIALGLPGLRSGVASAALGQGFSPLVTSSIGVLTNGGTIQANGVYSVGIIVYNGTIGTLTNTGLIQAGGTRSLGILVGRGGSIGTLVNAAHATITGDALAIGATGQIGSIVNSGTILASNTDGYAIALLRATPSGSPTNIVNNAGGLIQGAVASIINFGGSDSVAIVNAGQIVGDVFLGGMGDSLTITGNGTVAGNISGLSGSGGSVLFNTTGPYVLGNTIDGMDNIAVQSGTVTIQQFGSVTTPISNALAFGILPGGTVRLNSGTVQAAAFTNQGLLDIGTGTPAIDGSLTQTSTGRFGVGVTGPTNGLLTVTGAASMAGGIVVAAPTVVSQALGLIGQTFTVLTAGSLIAPVVGSTTTSATPGPAVVFTVGQNGNDLILTAKANPITNLLPPANPFNLAQVEFGFAGLANLLLSSNDLVNYAKVIAPFTNGTFTPAQQASILTKLEASLIGGNLVSLSSILSLEGAATAALNGRQTAMRDATGMAAGDEVGRGYQAWVQPFGSFQTQNAVSGFNATDGSTSNSYGVVFGADTMVRPDLRVGLALTIGNTDITYSGNLAGNKGAILTTQLAAYATWYQGHWFVDGAAGGGINWFTTHESAPAFGGSRDAGFNGTQLTARFGTGYDWLVGSQLTITPYASIQDMHFNTDGYTTHGLGLLDLKVNNKAFDVLQSRIGAKAAYTFSHGRYTYTPELHSYYLHNFGADQRLTTSESFVGGGPTFSTIGPARDRDVWNVGFGMTMAKIGRVTLTGTYDYLGGATASDHQIAARFRTDF